MQWSSPHGQLWSQLIPWKLCTLFHLGGHLKKTFCPLICFNDHLKTTFLLWHIFQFIPDLDVPVEKSLNEQLVKLLLSRNGPIWPFWCQRQNLGTFHSPWKILVDLSTELSIVLTKDSLCAAHRIYEAKSLLEIASFLQMTSRCTVEKSWQSLEICRTLRLTASTCWTNWTAGLFLTESI